MTFGNRAFAECHVAFRAREIRILLLRINFEVQNPAFVRGRSNVTAVSAATGLHRYFPRLEIDGAESRSVNLVTIQTIQIGVFTAFVTKSAGGNAATPTREHRRVRTHARGQRSIEINLRRSWRLQLVTDFATLRLGRDA